MLALPRTALLALFAATCVCAEGAKRKITVRNACKYTLWPGLFTSVGPAPAQAGGWEAKPGSTKSFEVEETWGGRIWGRTKCNFSDKSVPDYAACETGGCNGGLECAKSGGTGVPPVTLAEFNFQQAVDFYDTSVVDGFNIPIAITSSGKHCKPSNCPYNVLPSCPKALQKKNSKGKVVGCLTDCGASPQNAEYCCFGEHDTLATCPASGVPHLKWWKSMCAGAYAYAYDDHSSLNSCSDRSDYTVTFCPGKGLFSDTVELAHGGKAHQGPSSAARRSHGTKKATHA